MPDYQEISIDDYRQRFADGGEDYMLVDVRMDDEFEDGHLPGAINIPLPEIQSRLDEIPTDKPIVMVCRTGNRSDVSSMILSKAGYPEVYNLLGGTKDWAERGFPIEE